MIKLERSLIPSGEFYVAVSGGVDSIAAAHLLIRLYGDRVKIAHFNHNLRDQNYTMQNAVALFGKQFYSTCKTSIRENTTILGSVEDALRRDRLEFYKSLNSHIICCHHLNDAVESYVMNMLRGCPEYTPIPASTPIGNDHKIIRPFLKTTKSDFEDYAINNNLYEYIVVDETNKDYTYRRNWIRHEVMPLFKKYGLNKIVKKKFYTSK